MIRVQTEPFDIGAELAALTAGRTDLGGLACFVGLVRDFAPRDGDGNEDERIQAMTLEHYPGMTEKMLARIEEDARRRWPLDACLILHRYGRLLPGEGIVLVACAAAHREPALEACTFLIDWLKTKAPFWKREETPEGDRWVDSRASDDARAGRWLEPG